MQIRDENGEYMGDDQIIKAALSIIERRFVREPVMLTSPEDSQTYFSLRLGEYDHEVFAVMFLDTRHRLIAYEEMFRGTIDGATVHPREVVKAALKHNAAAVVLGHNHPSGIPEPSRSDRVLTERLRESLALVDVRVLDHIVVGETCVSFAERGMI